MTQRLSFRPSRRAFVDSGTYLALLDRRDQHHAEAVAVAHRLAQHRCRQFTTNAVIIECHALILSHVGIAQAPRFLRDMETSNALVLRMRARDEEQAKQIIFWYWAIDWHPADAATWEGLQN